MKCPFCGNRDTNVRDSRSVNEGTFIKRRRFCGECGAKFTTFETIQLKEIKVIKKNGSCESFDREKAMRSVEVALRKRPVTRERVDELMNSVIYKIERIHDAKITAKVIGELIMEELATLDKVAFIRFASVYMNFENEKDFVQLIGSLTS
ncbi:transcriptional regulator NrdR [Neorickettsia sennetsu]|uniref:Transcriptional repressor NrdR n=1 Tax=Ehrlichia sennetsu (strain ATCC VR-367 / Miyayama) TaxID=222891 RepID=NRDR_EHRS3|nr:transcriptional regulator NrdR [Neorickettsia sennetsu]Q2GE55.1 RecName: Full=Transcriptional repressor NrdR [Neorickettsia sennetsu str. Miyayama]ABD46431.1 ATP cone domain protein [Neorickettsia sennetsu str. Miyayama]